MLRNCRQSTYWNLDLPTSTTPKLAAVPADFYGYLGCPRGVEPSTRAQRARGAFSQDFGPNHDEFH